jgi:hypothetical protein
MTYGASKPYVIDDEDEPQRLERQAQLANLPQHLTLFLWPLMRRSWMPAAALVR